jgi:RNase adapter protein RapZ
VKASAADTAAIGTPQRDAILIGGVSGSGKSVALAALEDSGYYAVANLPLSLVAETADYLSRAGQDRVAITFDLKTGAGLSGLPEAMEGLRRAGWNARFLVLDARTETLVKRFSETRRRHPFSSDALTLTEAIEFERELLAEVRGQGFVFDTSDLSAAALRGWIKDFVSVDASRLTLQFESFGFKHGVPLDADLVFDVRCLPNPHYERALQPLTGRDDAVVEFLERLPEVERMYNDIYHFVAGWLPDYARDNRNYLTVAIGCTGGRHRSVYLVERLARAFSLRYQVLKRHREIGAAAEGQAIGEALDGGREP